MNNAQWHKAYDSWQKEQTERAREILNAPTGTCQVCEDGSVYLGNLVWAEAGTVTPWEDPDETK